MPISDEELSRLMDKPMELERLYRSNPKEFCSRFDSLYPSVAHLPVAQAWQARLSPHTDVPERSAPWWPILLLVFFAGLLAKMPDIIGIDHDFFYQRNLSFIVLPFLAVYFVWQRGASVSVAAAMGLLGVLSAVYINFLPDTQASDTLLLACLHLPMLLWQGVGFVFASPNWRAVSRRLDFLKFNGDLAIITAIILATGAVLTGLTFSLFMLIEVPIEKVMGRYLIYWAIPAAPLVGAFLVTTNGQLVSRVSPVIARVFSPLVLVTLSAYLVAVFATGKDPYNDRDFLILFNAMLLVVMAIVVFSATETTRSRSAKLGLWILIALAAVAALVNGVALSAILFRISSWGITPNRLAVLGGNLIILVHLLLVLLRLVQSAIGRRSIEAVESSIAQYLPVYALWASVVTFLFPVVFGFK